MTDSIFNEKLLSEHGIEPGEDASSVRFVLDAVYRSKGDQSAKIIDAIKVTVNGKVAAKLDAPDKLGDFPLKADITEYFIIGGANEVLIETPTYDFNALVGYIKTESRIRLRKGRRSIFNETFKCHTGFRISSERLIFPG
ncbi:MAG: hypothetical protein AAGF28_11640 [Pseudomonadota bacterium]